MRLIAELKVSSNQFRHGFRTNLDILVCKRKPSLASRLNGYMYSNGKSLNMALFILMANLCNYLGVKNIPCRVASLINIFN